MTFKIGKREKLLLAVLAVILYGFLFYRFILIPVMPEIKLKNQQLTQLNKQKIQLDSDIRNIELKKLELEAENAKNGELDESLINNGNITDSIEYVDKLSKMFNRDFTSVNFSQPQKRNTTNNQEFYEFGINFKTILSYKQIMDLVDYIEESSRLTKITDLKLKVMSNKEIENMKKKESPELNNLLTGSSKLLSIETKIYLYTLNLNNADKLYEFGRHKFNDYSDNTSDEPFVSDEDYKYDDNSSGQDGKSNSESYKEPDKVSGSSNRKAEDIKKNVDISMADVLILETSFLSSGHNLQVYGSDKLKDVFGMDTKNKVDINLNLKNSSFDINTLENGKDKGEINCPLSKNDLTVYISLDYPKIKENENLGINLHVSNDSKKKIYIKMEDKASGLRLFDRNGADLSGGNGSEAVIIL